MKAVQIIESKGRNILLMDLSGVADTDDLSKRVDEIIIEVKKSKKPKSVYALLDLTNLKMNKNTLSQMKKLSQNNGPYMKYVAFVGMNRIYSFIFKLMFKLTKRVNHNVIKTREEALIWLGSK